MTNDYIVLLHNIRSAHNVGSIFRTADAAGVSRIILSGYTPRPFDRFGRPVKEIAKTALGAEKSVPWEGVREPMRALRALKAQGYRIVAVEQDERALDYRNVRLRGKAVIIFGNEVRGLSKSIRSLADAMAEIPMRGAKESLNVSVAAGIALFRMLDR